MGQAGSHSALSRVRTRGLRARDWLAAVWDEHWVGSCAVLLILASDTKVVLKDRVSGASTAVDPFILAEVAVYGAVGAYLLVRRAAWRPRPTGIHPLEMLMIAFLALVALSVVFSAVPLYSAVRAGQTVVLVLLARAALATGSVRWFRSFSVLTLWMTAALVMVGLALPTQKGPLQVDRFNWLATHPVVVGQFTALAACVGLALSLGAWVGRGSLARDRALPPLVLLGVPTLVCGFALAATHTRGSAVAALLGGLAALMLVIPAAHRSSIALVGVWAVLLVTAAGAAWARSWFSRGEGLDSLLTLNSRTELWSLAVESTLRESPAIGFGVGASRSIFYAETGLGGGHNAAINVLADLGLLGLLVWIPLVLWPAMVVWRSQPVGPWRLDRAVWIVAFVVLIVNAVTYEGLGSTPTLAFTWLLLLVAVAVVIDEAEEPAAASINGSTAADQPSPPLREGTPA